MTPTLLVAGETLVDLIRRPDGMMDPKLGGSPYNLAVALGRLGCQVRYANPLSHDHFGQAIRAVFDEAKVQYTPKASPLPTSLACVTVDDQGKPSYGFYREGVADRDWDALSLLRADAAVASYLHVGSLALIPPDGQIWCEVLSQMRARGTLTSVDINMRLVAAPDHALYRQTVLSVMRQATVLKVSDEDLLDLHLLGDPLERARSLLSDATQLVVLTLAAKGAWAISASAQVFQAPAVVPVVDSVGAGDCFFAGFTCALLEMGWIAHGSLRPALTADNLASALQMGNQVTAFNLQQRGCVPPWRSQLG